MSSNSEIQGYKVYPMLHFCRKFSSSITADDKQKQHTRPTQDHLIRNQKLENSPPSMTSDKTYPATPNPTDQLQIFPSPYRVTQHPSPASTLGPDRKLMPAK